MEFGELYHIITGYWPSLVTNLIICISFAYHSHTTGRLFLVKAPRSRSFSIIWTSSVKLGELHGFYWPFILLDHLHIYHMSKSGVKVNSVYYYGEGTCGPVSAIEGLYSENENEAKILATHIGMKIVDMESKRVRDSGILEYLMLQ